MSKKVLKDLLDSFENTVNDSAAISSKSKMKLSVKKKKKTTQKTDPLSTIELYKKFRAAHAKHVPNLKSMKRRFFKHDPDKDTSKNNTNRKTQKSVFSDQDFENFISK